MSTRGPQASFEADSPCVVCFKSVEIYSIGVCDHPVCYDCSTRMRVLCKQKECPICRGDMPKVIYTKEKKTFAELLEKGEGANLHDAKYGIHFGMPSIQRAYYRLLEFSCQLCRGERHFKNFGQMRDHMRREHELFYCDLCVDNLKIFAFERRCYTRTELAQHRRKGDADNTSHRGHPLCEFCEQRYMDSDELFRHLRRDHLYCHFCDADGKHQYYSTYEDLRQHFLEDHYLCEEGDCKNEQFTSVFRSEIDWKAHVASVHSKHLSRAANKQARMLEVEFNFAPRRNEQGGQRGGRRQPNRNNYEDNGEGTASYETYNTEPGGMSQVFVNPLRDANFPSLNSGLPDGPGPSLGRASVTFTSKFTPNFSGDEFPTLGGGAAPKPNIPIGNQKNKKAEDFPTLGAPRNITITKTSAASVGRGSSSSAGLFRKPQNFPSLNDGAKGTSTLKFTLNSQTRPQSSGSNVSIQVNHKSNGAVTTRISTVPTSTVHVRPTTAEAFPALGPASTPVMPIKQWVQPKPKKQSEPKTAKAAPAPQLPPSSLSEFPTLSKTKKTSSVTMPVNNMWARDGENNRHKNAENTSRNTEAKPKSKKKEVRNVEVKGKSEVGNVEAKGKSEVGNVEGKGKSEVSNAEVKGKSEAKNVEATGKSEFRRDKFEVKEANEGRSKPKKKKGKNADNAAQQTVTSGVNGLIKKTSTLKIGNLETYDLMNGDTDEFPTLDNKPPAPPGITVKPPPGFSCLPKNDLTFTNSSGQTYSILPTHTYNQPADFNPRNSRLVRNFATVLTADGAMNEFKSYSELFRTGGYPAEKYYEHCRTVLGAAFERIFPELLALLPNIERQQELYRAHKVLEDDIRGLDVCATCKQVIASKDLKKHLESHYMENHFPTLGQTVTDTGNVWKK